MSRGLGPRRGRVGSLLGHVARWVSGIALILVGLVLAVPGIPGPGVLVALAGVLVLLPVSPWLRKTYARLKRRYPKPFQVVERRLRRRRGRQGRGAA